MPIDTQEVRYVFVVNDYFHHGGHVKSFLAQFDSLRDGLNRFLIVSSVGGFVVENRERLGIPQSCMLLIDQRRLRVFRFSTPLFLALRRVAVDGCIFHVYSDECYFSASLAKAFSKKNVALIHSVMGGPSPFPVLRSTDLYVAVAPEQLRLVERQYYSGSMPFRENCVVIKNRILFSHEVAPFVLDGHSRRFVLVVTRFDADKVVTLDRLKELLSALPNDLDVVFAGKGPLEERYRERFAARPNIKFVGFRRDIAAFYKNAFVVLGMGRSILEPMMQGVPAILVGFDGIDTLENLESVEFAAERNFAGRELFRRASIEEAVTRIVECSHADTGLRMDFVDYLNSEFRADLFRFKFLVALDRAEIRPVSVSLSIGEYCKYSFRRLGRMLERLWARIMLRF